MRFFPGPSDTPAVYEVEVKVEAEHGPVRERLADLGAESCGAVRQHDTYYDHPVRDFAETDEALRLRRESNADERADSGDGPTEATLTYKGPLVDDVSKTREEVEAGVDDPETADAILRAVGFEPAAEVEKVRERFAVGEYVVALDSVADLGEFVEVEAHVGGGEAEGQNGESENADVESLRTGAFDLCRRLGLDPAASTRSSYLALLLEATD